MKMLLMEVISVLLVIFFNAATSQRHRYRGIVEINHGRPARNRFHPCPIPGGKNGVCTPPHLCRVPADSMGFNGPPGHRGRQNHFCRPRNRRDGPMICCLETMFPDDRPDRPGEDIPYIPSVPNVPNVPNIPNVPNVPNIPNIPPNEPNNPQIPRPTRSPDVEDVDLSDKIIEDKCLEYSRVALEVESQPDPSASGGGVIFKPFVIGGVSSLAKEFPHMAILGFGTEDDISWRCGGSLISDKFILTAAHCIYTPSLGDLTFARVGDLNIQSTTDDAKPQQFGIVQRFSHPDYVSTSHYNDIALVQLDRPVIFTKYVRPACIQTVDDRSIQPIATGWGHTEFGGTSSDVLQKVGLVYYSFEQCSTTFGPQTKLSRGLDENSQICAGGGPDESKDTCQGDSGGPLQILTQDAPKMYKIVGITSFGKACGLTNIPAVYTNVAYFSPWIEDIIWSRE